MVIFVKKGSAWEQAYAPARDFPAGPSPVFPPVLGSVIDGTGNFIWVWGSLTMITGRVSLVAFYAV
ncbi:MAG: hypothetical protein C7B43_06385 [Sulfobacillus benefaciens]|uniref:Uncharacterized protein n=1 Tax=Sulfobacillus benefaciens TaxID=453960 RepID=A0A2T2X759_9FIRM|nr:MAG: hypothetical protein C7B43_06385 [Sulfobacillus benefaciens]